MKAKVNILAKPCMHLYIFFTLQLDSAWESSYIYNILQVADEAKTMPYFYKTIISLIDTLTVALLSHISGTT